MVAFSFLPSRLALKLGSTNGCINSSENSSCAPYIYISSQSHHFTSSPVNRLYITRTQTFTCTQLKINTADIQNPYPRRNTGKMCVKEMPSEQLPQTPCLKPECLPPQVDVFLSLCLVSTLLILIYTGR